MQTGEITTRSTKGFGKHRGGRGVRNKTKEWALDSPRKVRRRKKMGGHSWRDGTSLMQHGEVGDGFVSKSPCQPVGEVRGRTGERPVYTSGPIVRIFRSKEGFLRPEERLGKSILEGTEGSRRDDGVCYEGNIGKRTLRRRSPSEGLTKVHHEKLTHGGRLGGENILEVSKRASARIRVKLPLRSGQKRNPQERPG